MLLECIALKKLINNGGFEQGGAETEAEMPVYKSLYLRANLIKWLIVLSLMLLIFVTPTSPLAQTINPTREIQTLFSDDFSSPLSTSKWDYNHFESGGSFYGRTQQRQYLPQVSSGLLHLQLNTYNPTGPGNSFLGSEIISTQSFTIDAGGIAFEASARIVSSVPGLVGGFFGFHFDNTTKLDNEVDHELLSNDAVAGRNREQTNVYSNEPLGAGHPEFVPVTDLTKFHTYRIEWFANRVRWFIDSQLVREDTVHIPQGALALHLNIWAPAADWVDAYSASLEPTNDPAFDTSYYVDVDYVRVARLAPTLCCGDFNGDKKADILWRNNTSAESYILLMNGFSSLIGAGSPGTLTPDWQIAGIGDFNGDGKTDILWRNSSGELVLWLMNGTTISSQRSLGVIPNDWQVAGIGDFNGDGKADILWRNANGQVYITLMNGFSLVGAGSPGTLTPDWQVAGIGDFNGDGKADILWRNSSGELVLWLMNGPSISSQSSFGVISNDWQVAGIGDFNGDGKADILWRNANGQVYITLMNGFSLIGAGSPGTLTPDWQVAGAGDFSGDGKTDILWRNSSGELDLWLMNGTSILSQGSLGVISNDWQIE
jgi:hypothetical protein